MTDCDVREVERRCSSERSVQKLKESLDWLQDKFEPTEKCHTSERRLKRVIRQLDATALPAPEPAFLDTTGGKLARLGANKVEGLFAAHCPGVVFIDEAYHLSPQSDAEGKKVTDLLLTQMEEHRLEQVFILAGYRDEIDDLLKINPGFQSRITNRIHFNDYSKDELFNIFLSNVRNFGQGNNNSGGRCASWGR